MNSADALIQVGKGKQAAFQIAKKSVLKLLAFIIFADFRRLPPKHSAFLEAR